MRMHLIDGTYELFRAHYTPRPDVRSPKGKPIKATSGLMGSWSRCCTIPTRP